MRLNSTCSYFLASKKFHFYKLQCENYLYIDASIIIFVTYDEILKYFQKYKNIRCFQIFNFIFKERLLTKSVFQCISLSYLLEILLTFSFINFVLGKTSPEKTSKLLIFTKFSFFQFLSISNACHSTYLFHFFSFPPYSL